MKPEFPEKPAFPGGSAEAALLAGLPEPRGPAPLEAFGDPLASMERALPLNDPRVLCNNCVYGWIMAEPAAVKNLRPDGQPFKAYKGFCTLGPLSLEEIHPTECNRHTPPGPEKGGWLIRWFKRKP